MNELQSSHKELAMRPPKIADLKKAILHCLEEGRYLETTHVQVREIQRGITFQDITHVLKTGRHEKSKDSFDIAFQAWNYAMRGTTVDQKELRVIVSFDKELDLLIITAFYL